MLYIFEKKGSKKSRFFYLLVSLVAAYFVRQFLSAFYLQFSRFINNNYIFEDLLSVLSFSEQSTILTTCFSFISVVILGPYIGGDWFIEAILWIPFSLSPNTTWMSSYQLLYLGSVIWYCPIATPSVWWFIVFRSFLCFSLPLDKEFKNHHLCHSFINFSFMQISFGYCFSNLIYNRFF